MKSYLPLLFLSAVFPLAPFQAVYGEDHAAKDSQVDCVKLERLTPKGVFTGKISYSLTAEMSFEENGKLKKLLGPGSSFSSEIRNTGGSILRKGDIVAQQDTYAAENKVNINTTKLKAAENNLRKMEDDYRRDKSLYEKQALSQANFKHTESSLIAAQLSYAEAQLALDLAQRSLEVCTLRAPFDGEVDETYMSEGFAVDHGKKVVSLVSLSPMKVTVKLPPSLTRKLDRTVKVLVHPSDPAKAPQVAWMSKNSVKTDSLECYVANPLYDLGASPETANLPVVRNLGFVSQLSGTKDIAPFWIQPETLVQDGDSFYVWRIKGLTLGNPNSSITRVMTVEKVPVTPGNQEMVQGMFRLRGVEKGELKRHDILLSNPPEGLTDGCKVAYLEQRRLFRYGEDVSVKFVPDLGRTGFYVPREAVVDGRILSLVNGKLKAVDVKVVDEYNSMVCIEGQDLKEGMIVAVPDSYPVLYEDRDVKSEDVKLKAVDLDSSAIPAKK